MSRLLALVALSLLFLSAAGGKSHSAPTAPKCVGPFPPTIVGTPGDDVLNGTPEHDIIASLGGNDTINGGGGGDTVCAGPGDDVVRIEPLPEHNLDLVKAGPGNDQIILPGTPFAYQLVYPGPGNDRIECNPRTHVSLLTRVVVDLRAGTARGEGNDRLLNCSTVSANGVLLGTDGPDYLSGGAGADLLFGRGGRDFLRGEPGNDLLDGGAGVDRVDYTANAHCPIRVDLRAGRARGDGVDTLRRIEGIQGSDCPDVIRGNAGSNTIRGGGGKDRIFGHGGKDWLIGEAGFDVIFGGPGRDHCEGEATSSCP
jgi:Ca2+-binding RTX toxin-like protein